MPAVQQHVRVPRKPFAVARPAWPAAAGIVEHELDSATWGRSLAPGGSARERDRRNEYTFLRSPVKHRVGANQ
jgi:hypothetical protein